MRTRFYVSALIFVLLTGIKLFFPAVALNVHDTVIPKITGGEDLRSAMIALGNKLSGEEEIIYASKDGSEELPPDVKRKRVDISADFNLPDMVKNNLSESSLNFIETQAPEEIPVESEDTSAGPAASDSYIEDEESSAKNEKTQKLEAFLETQSAFSDYELPAGVSYEIPAMGFECTLPCEAAVSSAFGFRIHPIHNEARFHYGSDYALNDGDGVSAFADGKVISTQELSGYGYALVIEHPDGYTTLYAHLSQILVNVGDSVSLGQKVALSGHSGDTTGPHLHFEVERSGVRYNPELCF